MLNDEIEKVKKIEQHCNIVNQSFESDKEGSAQLLDDIQTALASVNKKKLHEMRQLPSVNADAATVLGIVTLIMEKKLYKGTQKELQWQHICKKMGNVDTFFKQLGNFHKKIMSGNYSTANLETAMTWMGNSTLSKEVLEKKQPSLAGLYAWAQHTNFFAELTVDIAEKKQQKDKLLQDFTSASNQLASVQVVVKEKRTRLRDLVSQHEIALAALNTLKGKADKLNKKLLLAEKLGSCLEEEEKQWQREIKAIVASNWTLVGDCLLAAAFITYAGPFYPSYRHYLLETQWLPLIHASPIPLSETFNVIELMVTREETLHLEDEHLATQEFYVQNALILEHTKTWPVLVDPQTLGADWLMTRIPDLSVVKMVDHKCLDAVTKAMESGTAILVKIPPSPGNEALLPLTSVLHCQRPDDGEPHMLWVEGKHVHVLPGFRLYLQTRNQNPHFVDEVYASTTIVTFTVTRQAITSKLLDMVAKNELPYVEKERTMLKEQRLHLQLQQLELETRVIQLISGTKGNLLDNHPNVVNEIEDTKNKISGLQEQLQFTNADKVEEEINQYYSFAERCSLLHSLLRSLSCLDPWYQFSLEVFIRLTERIAKVGKVGGGDPVNVQQRVKELTEAVTWNTFEFASRGMQDKHRLTLLTKLCFTFYCNKKKVKRNHLNFFMTGIDLENKKKTIENPFLWLPGTVWERVAVLSGLDSFETLASDVEAAGNRWRSWYEETDPETVELPGKWERASPAQKLLVLRALRPDRLVVACKRFIGNTKELGPRYLTPFFLRLDKIITNEMTAISPVLFILTKEHTGSDPGEWLGKTLRTLGHSEENGDVVLMTMGPNRESTAQAAIDNAADPSKKGGFVYIGNVHHAKKDWIRALEHRLHDFAHHGGVHPNFRLFVSSEVSDTLPYILHNSIKINTECASNVSTSFQEAILSTELPQNLNKDSDSSSSFKFQCILFTLAFFHSLVIGRKKFGSAGWNLPYVFLQEYEACTSMLIDVFDAGFYDVNFHILKYHFTEIIYGGTVTDEWDMRVVRTLMDRWMTPALFTDGYELMPGLTRPDFPQTMPDLDYMLEKRHAFSDSAETFGLYQNVELILMEERGTLLLEELKEMNLSISDDTVASVHDPELQKEEENKQSLAVKLGNSIFSPTMRSIIESLEQHLLSLKVLDLSSCQRHIHDPLVWALSTECQRMNALLAVVSTSLQELKEAYSGIRILSTATEHVLAELWQARVPENWSRKSFISLKPLAGWCADLVARYKQLREWLFDMVPPLVLWLGGLFEPQCFLAALLQSGAKRSKCSMEDVKFQTAVTDKAPHEITRLCYNGIYISHISLQGASLQAGFLTEALEKQLLTALPVLMIKVVPKSLLEPDTEQGRKFTCPVFQTSSRRDCIFSVALQSRENPEKWIMRSTAMLLNSD